MKLLVPLLAIVTIFAVGFVLVELRAPLARAPQPPAPAPAATTTGERPLPARPPVAAPLPSAAPPVAPPVASPAAPPVAPPSDPLDVVVRGKTRREWHAYYAERQRQIVADLQRYQSIVDRAIAGE